MIIYINNLFKIMIFTENNQTTVYTQHTVQSCATAPGELAVFGVNFKGYQCTSAFLYPPVHYSLIKATYLRIANIPEIIILKQHEPSKHKADIPEVDRFPISTIGK